MMIFLLQLLNLKIIETFGRGMKQVVLKKYAFEYRDLSKLNAIFKLSGFWRKEQID